MELAAMLVKHIMRAPAITVTPDTSVRAAAALMDKFSTGVLPVVLDGLAVGVITDRDITIRWVPSSTVDTTVASIMSSEVVICRADQTVEEAAHVMADRQIRQVVVVGAKGVIQGVVLLDNIANDASEELAGQTLGEIVEHR